MTLNLFASPGRYSFLLLLPTPPREPQDLSLQITAGRDRAMKGEVGTWAMKVKVAQCRYLPIEARQAYLGKRSLARVCVLCESGKAKEEDWLF